MSRREDTSPDSEFYADAVAIVSADLELRLLLSALDAHSAASAQRYARRARKPAEYYV